MCTYRLAALSALSRWVYTHTGTGSRATGIPLYMCLSQYYECVVHTGTGTGINNTMHIVGLLRSNHGNNYSVIVHSRASPILCTSYVYDVQGEVHSTSVHSRARAI